MTLLTLINKCLVELNYKPVNTFSELTKNEHKKIINIINLLNAEICLYSRWNFLVRKSTLELPTGMREVKNSINGRISQLIIDDIPFQYTDNVSEIFANISSGENLYSVFEGKLIFSKQFDSPQNIEVIYYTFNNTVSSSGKEKDVLELADDCSLIPMPFQEAVLVYGACMRLKGNPQHIRFSYWLSMYREALANLMSHCSLDAMFEPKVVLKRM